MGIRGTFSPVLGVKLWNHILIKNNKGDDETIFHDFFFIVHFNFQLTIKQNWSVQESVFITAHICFRPDTLNNWVECNNADLGC